MKRHILLTAIFAAGLAWVAEASAQQNPDKRWDRIEIMRIWKLTEVLELDDEAMAKIIPVVRDYNGKMRQKALEREKALRELRKVCGPSGNGTTTGDKSIADSTKKIFDLENEMMTIRHAHYKDMEKRLTIRQMGRYMLFEIRFQDEIQKFLHEFKGGRKGMGRGAMGKGQAVPPPPPIEEPPDEEPEEAPPDEESEE